MNENRRSDFSIAGFGALSLGCAAALCSFSMQAYADDRVPGTAVVRVDDTEYTIPIECDDANRPELGFSTEPSRITREATGRTSPVRLTLRRWQDTDELVVTLDRYVAWVPSPSSSGGAFALTLDMSPSSVVRDGIPVTMTYDQWTSGDRPPGLTAVRIDADCRNRDPDAPASRRLATAED